MDPSSGHGLVLFFTGLSGAGKTTIATLVKEMLEARGKRVTYLDGDAVRQHLSKGLGFSREDRTANIERIGFVASEVARHGGIAICAAIAPYKQSRDVNRKRVGEFGTYIEIFVSTPLAVCESRDTKGLYRKAKAGEILNMTGINDPYEIPEHPELTLDGSTPDPKQAAEQVLTYLTDRKLV